LAIGLEDLRCESAVLSYERAGAVQTAIQMSTPRLNLRRSQCVVDRPLAGVIVLIRALRAHKTDDTPASQISGFDANQRTLPASA
jgi:hypothetical protein